MTFKKLNFEYKHLDWILQMYEQYDDEEIGALDEDDIAGCVPQNSDLLNNALDEFEEQMKQV